MAGLVLDPLPVHVLPLLRRDIGLHIYSIGDLDPFFAPFTTWFGWSTGSSRGELTAVAMLYTPDRSATPTLLALSANPAPLRDLLRAIVPDLPPQLYAHVTPSAVDTLTAHYGVESHEDHVKMTLPAEATLPASPTGTPERIDRLTPGDLKEVRHLYRISYPDNWFDPRMLETERYLGMRLDGILTAVAGVHVYSPLFGVAALGNITTHPDYRSRGYGRLITAELCRILRADRLEIGLNVDARNRSALRAYRAVGFIPTADYAELTLHRREPERSNAHDYFGYT